MTTVLTEGTLTFEFSNQWQVCKYDDTPFYNGIKSQSLKGVDFLALSSDGLLFMEVKEVTASDENSRVRFSERADSQQVQRIKSLLTQDQLKTVDIKSSRPYVVDEISKKVRDTLLGLLASHRTGNNITTGLPPFNSEQKIIVVFFLERNTELNEVGQFGLLASNLRIAIEKKLKFFGNIQVSVVNSLTLPNTLGIQVKK